MSVNRKEMILNTRVKYNVLSALCHTLNVYTVNQQISEMNSFQQSLLELERTQQSQKKQ